MTVLLPLVLAALIAGSQLVTNPEDMGKAFEKAQRLLATGDFSGARRAYERLLRIDDQALLRASAVKVVVDEQEVELQDGARYQLANMDRRQAQLWRREAALAAEQKADSLWRRAGEYLRRAAARFALLRDEEGFSLRERAAFLVLDSFFEAEEYAKAVQAGQVLLDSFPQGRYASRARYTMGWAYFHLERYEQAVERFEAYVKANPQGIRADRARLQMGLALEKLERYPQALEAFAGLARSYDPASMSYTERTAAALEGLRQGQSRRSLAARAWIKQGDVLERLGRPGEALEAYRKIGRDFPQEEHWAEVAWVRQALLAQQVQGLEGAVAVYRHAAEKAPRPAFRARMQAGLMSLLFEQGRYAEALEAHRLYLSAYGEQTEEAGVSVDEARFRLAECLRLLGEETAAVDSARALNEEAVAAYQKVLEDPQSYLVPEALFWQGISLQSLGRVQEAEARFERVARDYARTPLACRAVLQRARMRQGEAEALYVQILDQCEEEEVRAFAALELGHRRRLEGRLDEAEALLESIAPAQAQYVQAQMERAQLYLERGALGPAQTLLEQQLEQAADVGLRAQLEAQLGLVHQKRGEHEQALRLLRRALPRLRGALRPAARFGLGWSLYQRREYEAAWAQWSAALRREHPDRVQQRTLLRGLGLCARALGDSARLAVVYEELLADEATRAEARLQLGQFYLDGGRGAKAAAQVRGLLAHPEREIALRARLVLGRALLAQDSLEQARRILKGGLREVKEPSLAAEYHFHLGSAALGLREYDAAAEAFGAAFSTAPRRAMQAASLYYLAHSLSAAGERQAARQRFAELAAQYPEQPRAPEAAFNAAEIYYGEGAYPQALDAYRRVFGKWPRSKEAPQALYGAAWCRLEMGEGEPMRALFVRLARDYPSHARAPEGLLNAADYFYNGGQYAKAAQLYEELREQFPASREAAAARRMRIYLSDREADGLYKRAMALYDERRYAEAISLLQQVVIQHPGTPSEAAARCNIGMAYQKMGEWRRAVRAYDEAIATLEERPEEKRALVFAQQNRSWIVKQVWNE